LSVRRSTDRRPTLPRPLRSSLLALLVAAACTSPGAGGRPASTAHRAPSASPDAPRFAQHGVSFSYPSGWTPTETADASASTGSRLWSAALALDARNIVSVSTYRIGTSITEANVAARSSEVRAQLESVVAQAGGSLRSGPTSLRMAGLPALAFEARVRTPAGRRLGSRLVLAFDGTTEYFVNCQSDAAGRGAVRSACDQIVSTFDISVAASQD
jgi:hypothetical protein